MTTMAFRNEAEMAIQTCKEWNVPYKVVTLDYTIMFTHYHRMWLHMVLTFLGLI